MFQKQVNRILGKYILSTYKHVDVLPGNLRWNWRCHNNAVHEAINNNEDEIALVMYFEDNCAITHFINTYVDIYGVRRYRDDTLGHWCSQYKYYFVHFISKEDFFNVYSFHKKHRYYMRSLIPWYYRIFNNTTT